MNNYSEAQIIDMFINSLLIICAIMILFFGTKAFVIHFGKFYGLTFGFILFLCMAGIAVG